jgi:hypothetical protein
MGVRYGESAQWSTSAEDYKQRSLPTFVVLLGAYIYIGIAATMKGRDDSYSKSLRLGNNHLWPSRGTWRQACDERAIRSSIHKKMVLDVDRYLYQNCKL